MDFTRRDNGLNQYQMWSPYSAIYHDDNWFGPWVRPGNGVLMADGYITASYNALNQPVAMGSQGLGSNFYWFWHDPLGRCVKRWLGNDSGVPTGPITYFYYDGWNLVQEGPNASTADRLYVHGGRVDEIVASKLGGQWYNHQYDARGHCLLLTDSSGAIQEQYDYDAFGMPYFYNAAGTSLGNSGGVGNRFLFTGREWIKDLRVYDYRHRMYQPELGRFLQPDPKQFKAGDYNLYRYCHNDPINKSDPTGMIAIFRFTDGTVKKTESGSEFAKIAGNAAKGSLDAVIVKGHGTKDFITLNSSSFQKKSDSSLQKLADGKVYVMDPKSKAEGGVVGEVGALLRGKFHDQGGARIGLIGCNTATVFGDDNITRAVSLGVPGVRVYGETIAPINWFHSGFVTPDPFSLFQFAEKTYINGENR